MSPRRDPVRSLTSRFLWSVLVAGALAACGGSPNVVGSDPGPDNPPGDSGDAGAAGTDGGGPIFDFDGGSHDKPDATMDLPEAGPGCGDGLVNQPDEECDDAKSPHGGLDDCSGVEAGYLCSQPGKPCTKVKVAVCGDGALDPGEQCDDGNNATPGDGCGSTCMVDVGWVCPTVGMPCL